VEHRLPAGAFFGRVDRRLEAAGLILSETRFPAHHDIPSHAHENAYFRFVLEGLSTDVTRRRTFQSGPGTLVFHPADDPHANHWSESGGRSLNIEVSPSWLDRLGTRGPSLDRPGEYGGGMPVWIARRIHREFVEQDPLAPLAIEGIMLQLLTDVLRSAERPGSRPAPAWLRQVRDLLEERFTEGLSMGELAATAGVNTDHLARSFRQQYGRTIGEYVRQRRIEYACRQIIQAEMSLVDIALGAGFYDQSHFTRTFKRLVGMTPVEFREARRAYRLDTRE
jgi:AraC family transcriptional regulator